LDWIGLLEVILIFKQLVEDKCTPFLTHN